MEPTGKAYVRSFGVALLAALSVGCTDATEPKLGEEFQLRVGETVVVSDIGLWLAFLEVSEDSRCALQAMCVWAGDAAVVVETAPFPDALHVDSKTDTLHTNLDPKTLPLGAVELVLVRLDPYPETPGSITAEQYVATFATRPAR